IVPVSQVIESLANTGRFKIAFIGVLSGFLLNYYINPENSSEFLSCLAFVLIFMFSAGVLASLGVHEAFLKEFDIKTTY
ncbi:MAG: hypothetical protein V7753_09360, partial [Pseudoalteromonas distincta]